MKGNDMTDADKIRLLTKAVLELADKVAVEWNYDGEQILSTGVTLEDESELKEINKRERNRQ